MSGEANGSRVASPIPLATVFVQSNEPSSGLHYRQGRPQRPYGIVVEGVIELPRWLTQQQNLCQRPGSANMHSDSSGLMFAGTEIDRHQATIAIWRKNPNILVTSYGENGMLQ